MRRCAMPHIVGYSVLAATAGAIPVPWLALLILPGIQTRMIYHLARLYGQPLTGTRFLELASTLGLGMVARQAMRELMKFIPYVGSVAGAALAGASTFALGKAFCFYYSAVHKGHVPRPEDLRRYYQEQLVLAEQAWKHQQSPADVTDPAAGTDAAYAPAAPAAPPGRCHEPLAHRHRPAPVAVPLLFLAGLGSYRLWQLGLAVYVWWPLSACMAVGYFLGWYWLRQKQLIKPIDFSATMHWTERDREAWKLVEARARQVAELQSIELQELQFYVQIAQEMALELARFYHPQASDPIGSLTIPEILAVAELAAHDLAELVNDNVPGGHVLTVNQWRWAKRAAEQATSWWRTGSNAYWLFSAIVSPIDTGLKYAASQVGMSRPWQLFQQDLIAWFHTAFVHRLGSYLIDLNSGRLRVGAGVIAS